MVLLFAMTGAMLISASADLLVLFVALELMVLPGYMLAGYHKTDGYSTEGAIKYFLLGSFSSGIFLFGLAFTWGATGTTSIEGVSNALSAAVSSGAGISSALVLGLGFLTTGVAFKIAAVPVPLLDARRVPGLADPGHGLPVRRPQGRGVRADPAAVRRCPRARSASTGSRSSSSSPS
jgi:NADH-quinone oxidoreductase subunit N